jgi:unsaturated rhamnogalacturonyl hydrolase
VNRFCYLAAALGAAVSVSAAAPRALTVTVRNDLAIARPSETIEMSAASLAPLGDDLTRIHVYEKSKEVLAQSLDGMLIFQTDMPPHGSRSFALRLGDKRVYKRSDFRAYGRFVRERFDDFAWENDRVAHRMYGAALETWQQEPLTSSTVDVWLKRTRRLVINDWYMVDDYHRDTGEGADFYSAGKSRGCGGGGVWRDGKLVVSKNFRDSKVIANGPIRLIFELYYPDFKETKRITLDAGQNFNRFESNVTDAEGIKKTPTQNMRVDRENGILRAWDAVANNNGEFGCAVVFDPKTIADVVEADGNQLVVTKTPGVYWVGTGWDRSGDFANRDAFDRYVDQFVQRLRSPLRVEVKP